MATSSTLSEVDALVNEEPEDMILLSEPCAPSVGTGQGTTSQPSVVNTSQGTTFSQPSIISTSPGTSSQPLNSTSQGTTSSLASANTSQGTTSKPSVSTDQGTTSSMSSNPLPGGGPRRQKYRLDRFGNNGLEKKKQFEMTVLRERQMMVEIPLLGSLHCAAASGSRWAQCSISDCSGDDSKRHAFQYHLPGIFRE